MNSYGTHTQGANTDIAAQPAGVKTEPVAGSDTDAILGSTQMMPVAAGCTGSTITIDPTASVPGSELIALAGRYADFGPTWEHNRPGMSSPNEYEQALVRMAADAGWPHQRLADLVVMNRREHLSKCGSGDVPMPYASEIEALIRLARDLARRDREARQIQDLKEEVEEIIASVRGGNVYPSADQRETMMLYLSHVLRIGIGDMVKFTSDPPVFVCRLEGGKEIEVARVDDLLSQARFRRRLIAAVGDAPEKMPGAEWDYLSRVIMKSFREDSDGICGTAERFLELVQDYLAVTETEGDLREAIDNGYVFRDNEHLYIYKPFLLKWAMDRRGQRLDHAQADIMLKRTGFVSVEKHQRGAHKNLWRVPQELCAGLKGDDLISVAPSAA